MHAREAGADHRWTGETHMRKDLQSKSHWQQQQGRDCSLDWARGVKHCATKMMANGIGHMQAHAAADAPAVTAAALEAPAS